MELFEIGCRRNAKRCAVVWLLNHNPSAHPSYGDESLQHKGNKQLSSIIRKLDKHALNMYTPLRARLGPKIRAGFALLSAAYGRTGMAQSFRRNGSNEQDYWN
jgi:hypothetical protein